MSTLAIVLIVVAVVVVLLLAGGYAATRRRSSQTDWAQAVADADHALTRARAADKGWDRAALEVTARTALQERRPDLSYDDLHLVLVDDQPGVEEDRAHFAAVSPDGEARVVLVRSSDGWSPERVE